MEPVINEGHLVASPHPSQSQIGWSAPIFPGMGMKGRTLRPHFTCKRPYWLLLPEKACLFYSGSPKLWHPRDRLWAGPRCGNSFLSPKCLNILGDISEIDLPQRGLKRGGDMICLSTSNKVCRYGCFLLCLQGNLGWGAGAWEIPRNE